MRIDLRAWLRPQLSTLRSPGCGERGFGMRSVVCGARRRGTDSGEDGDEALKASRRSEALHHPLPLSQRHMRILGPVVQTFVGSVFDVRHDLPPGCSIRAQLVSDHPLRCDTLLLQKTGQQSPGSLGVAAVLIDFVEHIPVLIDGPPYPMFPAGDGDDDLVQVPHIVAAGLLAAKATRIIWAELLSPAADCFLGDGNAALQQQFFDKAQAQRKPKVEPDRVGDDLGWEAMALVADW